MAKAGYSVSVVKLRDDFTIYAEMAKKGAVIEIMDRRTPIGILAKNSENVTSKDHTYSERDATRQLRELFALVDAGKTVVIARHGGDELLLTKPESNGPK